MADNLTAVLYKIDDLRLENRPIPEPKDDEVLLKMGSVGICGSDVHYLEKGRIGDFIVKAPMIMGHEASGTVVKCGSKVKHLKEGDRVAIEPGVPCRYCLFCKEGNYHLCPDMVFCATPPVHGNLSRYYTHAADFCHKLPDHVSLDEGAVLEPLSVGVHACKRRGVTLGSVVLVLGAGPIGLVTILVAKHMGAGHVICIDLLENRLAVAKECGADYTLKRNATDDVDSVAAKIEEIFTVKPNISIDCGGSQRTVNIGFKATRNGGKFVMVGMGSNEVTIPLVAASAREVDIIGVFRYCNDYPLALSMVASGKVNVKRLITHHFKLEETVKAFETARKFIGNPIKVIIHCNE
uniref:Sorbitol dehydrogenase n=1 Tax=Pyrrhocoris apterus TaxID=37000 RepID=A7UKR5_PYRAP|nr:sorbitol dehydrogenase [Pyrrhocoris apterus]